MNMPAIIPQRASDIADRLAKAHKQRKRFAVLAELAADVDLAYAVQDDLVRRWAEEGQGDVIGWKIGLTTPHMQKMCGVRQPIAGAILSARAHASGATIHSDEFVRLGVESEIAVRMGTPLALDEPCDPARVLGCIDSVCAAFELIEDRDADYSALEAASLVADNSWNAGVVFGPPSPASSFRTLLGLQGRLVVNDALLDEGDSDAVGGDPLRVVDWLARFLASRGRALEPGQWVMTGSIVTTKFPRNGDHYRCEIDPLAPVEMFVT